MAKAYQTRGTTGHTLIAGFDTAGQGIQIDTSYGETKIHAMETPEHNWKEIRLVNLINSSNDTLNLLGKHLERENYDLFSYCYYVKEHDIHFIQIDNKEFRVKGHNIVEKTKD